MSASNSPSKESHSPRRPLDSQRGLGGDMSMIFFVRTQAPKKFASTLDHQIKGLNLETIAAIHFPTPEWMSAPEYTDLLPDNDNDSNMKSFSLNLSVYNHAIMPDDWSDMWFHMYGRVHPYALTWELLPDNYWGGDDNNPQEYTIPALIVRDHGYQPIAPRMLDSTTDFPMTAPIVTFTGPIIGSGQKMLHNDLIPNFSDIQPKCCGFLQLSSFITPGDPTKTPFKGFHPFSVFVIFPIHVIPWTILCKRMIERLDSQFHPNTMFSCTGKVAGFLNHKFMVHPPQLPQDYVFIVVPDSWTFHDKTTKALIPGPSQITTPDRKSSTADPFNKSKFLSPSKRLSGSCSAPATTLSHNNHHNPPHPSKHHIDEDVQLSTSAKRACTAPQVFNSTDTSHHDASNNPQHAEDMDPTTTPNLVPYSIPTFPQSHEETTRPHRNRQIPKKYSTVDSANLKI